ncbi:MAG: Rpn family recombination-promoting nuclease/putative transposase [Planctomycetota bacterium]
MGRQPPPSPMSPDPHDRLTKATFSDPAHAAGELRSVLPREVVESLDFDTLTQYRGEWHDKLLAKRQSDLLFSIQGRGGGQALIYVVVEHKSTLDPMAPLQLLGYMVRLWEAWLAQNPTARQLPAILPVVLAHDLREWRSPRRFGELFGATGEPAGPLAPFLPDFYFFLDDLAAQPDQVLRKREMTPPGKLTLLALRNMRGERDLFDLLWDWLGLLREASKGSPAGEVLSELICYILEVRPETDVSQVERFIAMNVDKSISEPFVSIADHLRAEGRSEGHSAGLLEGKRLLLVQLMTTRFGALPPEFSRRIQTGGHAELDRWAQRILSASSLADVFAETGESRGD